MFLWSNKINIKILAWKKNGNICFFQWTQSMINESYDKCEQRKPRSACCTVTGTKKKEEKKKKVRIRLLWVYAVCIWTLSNVKAKSFFFLLTRKVLMQPDACTVLHVYIHLDENFLDIKSLLNVTKSYNFPPQLCPWHVKFPNKLVNISQAIRRNFIVGHIQYITIITKWPYYAVNIDPDHPSTQSCLKLQ